MREEEYQEKLIKFQKLQKDTFYDETMPIDVVFIEKALDELAKFSKENHEFLEEMERRKEIKKKQLESQVTERLQLESEKFRENIPIDIQNELMHDRVKFSEQFEEYKGPGMKEMMDKIPVSPPLETMKQQQNITPIFQKAKPKTLDERLRDAIAKKR